MLTEPLTSTTNPFFIWNTIGAPNRLLGNGVANITWSSTIPMLDVEQLNLGIIVVGVTNVVMQIKGGHDNATWYPLTVRNAGAIVAGAQRYTPLVYELGPITATGAPGTFLDESRPVAWHYVQVGFYGVGAPAGGDSVTIVVERQRTASQIQAAV